MKYSLIIFLFIFSLQNGYTQDFIKSFGLFDIKISKNKCFFIPKDSRLATMLGDKSEFGFSSKILLYEGSEYYGYGINIDNKIIVNDSLMVDMHYGYNMRNTTVIEQRFNNLLVSVPIINNESRKEVKFFLYDLKNKKVLVDDSTFFLNRVTASGYLVEKRIEIENNWESDVYFNFINPNGLIQYNWCHDVDFINNDSIVKNVFSEALLFYNRFSQCQYYCDRFFYIDHLGKSNWIELKREEYWPASEFYFTDYYNSSIKNDTIYVAFGEAKFVKYVSMLSPISFRFSSDSTGPDKTKEYIPFDTIGLFVMDYSDFYITTCAPKYYMNANGEVQDSHYGDIKVFDSKDSLENGIHFIDQNFTGFLNIYNHKLKKMIDFNDQYLVDFNDKYFLVAKRIIIQKEGILKMGQEYFIYNHNLDLIKSTGDKQAFYKL